MPTPAPTPLRLRPELDELERLTGHIEIFAEEQNLRAKDMYALTLAVEELFANTVNHSQPPATFVEVTMGIEADGLVSVEYVDDGSAFDPTQQADPDLTLGTAERQIGGLGVYFIRTSMEDFRYARRDGCNVTSFRRRPAA